MADDAPAPTGFEQRLRCALLGYDLARDVETVHRDLRTWAIEGHLGNVDIIERLEETQKKVKGLVRDCGLPEASTTARRADELVRLAKEAPKVPPGGFPQPSMAEIMYAKEPPKGIPLLNEFGKFQDELVSASYSEGKSEEYARRRAEGAGVIGVLSGKQLGALIDAGYANDPNIPSARRERFAKKLAQDLKELTLEERAGVDQILLKMQSSPKS